MQKAALTTHLSPDGESHTEADFALRTKALYLELQLPADSELWSAEIDGTPIKPQRESKSMLIGLPAVAGNTLHTLKVVYRTPTAELRDCAATWNLPGRNCCSAPTATRKPSKCRWPIWSGNSACRAAMKSSARPAPSRPTNSTAPPPRR